MSLNQKKRLMLRSIAMRPRSEICLLLDEMASEIRRWVGKNEKFLPTQRFLVAEVGAA